MLKYLLQKGFLHGDCMTVTGEPHGHALRAQYKYVDCRVECRVGDSVLVIGVVTTVKQRKA